MPIYNVNKDGNKEVVFGSGDIKISSGWVKEDKSIGVITLRQQEPQPIGQVVNHEPYEETDMGEAPVRMTFHKVESIDVLIERLEVVKKRMKGDTKNGPINKQN